MAAVALPTSSDDPNREELIKAKERAILTLGETLSKYGFAEGTNERTIVNFFFIKAVHAHAPSSQG